MRRLLATAVLAATFAAGLAGHAVAADAKQELTINRGSTTDQVSGVVVQGNSVVLVYGAMGTGAQAVRITPEGGHIKVTYDTVGGLGLNPANAPAPMMMTNGGRQIPIYNMGASGSN